MHINCISDCAREKKINNVLQNEISDKAEYAFFKKANAVESHRIFFCKFMTHAFIFMILVFFYQIFPCLSLAQRIFRA